jgi:hypothetical protein
LTKIKYSTNTMEQIPLGWRWVEQKECYVCMCGYSTETPAGFEYHMSEEVEGGYCENGFRCLSDTHYECVCGKIFETSYDTWRHRRDIFNTCIDEAKYKVKAYCSKCELQFKTPYALNIHYTTKRHLEGDGPVMKDLECKPCGITCPGPKRMKAHLQSAKHKQRTEEGTLPLTCDVCNITCKGQKQMKAHLETNKHKKRCSLKTETNELVIP